MKSFAAWLLVFAACAPLGVHRPGTPDTPEVLAVVLEDGSITVHPRQVARGKIGLDIENRGTLEHALRIVGPGVDEQSAEFLGPNEHRRRWLRLEPGTYRVFCPDGDHAERGMWAHIIVTEKPTWFRR
ncbi:MAG TPA: sulfocyanin-like copper-binding protein [Polyangia bacterium]|nr:sulfocyanin-like copper-binding protein [Polyangia bacterium]